jgi:light-harvesting protein B-800-850 alpha chain
MNQGRIWCVVSPNVGLPLLLGSVAVTSLIVHTCVMTHTTWMSNYWQGSARPKVAAIDKPSSVASVAPQAAPAFVLSIAPVAGTPGKTESSFVVTVAPNPAATTASSGAVPPAGKTVALAAATSD